MKKKYIYLLMFFVCLACCIQMQSCNQLEIEAYSSGRALFFERERIDEETAIWYRSDTVNVSLTNYPGKTQIEIPFKICLIGDFLSEDTAYEIVRVDSLTTAKEGMVTLPEKILFRKNVAVDSLWVTIHTDKVEKEAEYYITYRFIPNNNFNIGYRGYTDVKLWFNNKNVKPLWWNTVIENVYLGKWTPKKMGMFIIATEGITSMEVDMPAWQKRLYSLKLKNYIIRHGVTEEDGTLMVVPVY